MKRILTSILLAAVLVCSFVMPTGASGLFPSNFTPSVTAKTAPEIVPYVKETVEYAATLVRIHEDGTETVVKDLLPSAVSVVSYGNINKEGVDEALAQQLTLAHEQITESLDLGELCPALDDIVKDINADYTTANLVASDLFDLSLASEDLATLRTSEDIVLRVTFNFKLAEDEAAPVIMHRIPETGKWQAVAYDSVSISGEDMITVDFSGLCPIVFLRVSPSRAFAPVDWSSLLFVVGIIVLAFLLFILIRALVVSVKRNKRRAAIIASEEGFLDGYYAVAEEKYRPSRAYTSEISIERINSEDE